MASLECDNIIQDSWYDSNIILEVNRYKVATIYLNRQDKHNALDEQMIAGLNSAFDSLENYLSEYDGNIKLLILRANGKSFCAGADLKAMQKMIDYNFDENYQDAIALARVLDRLANFAAPTLAVIQGNAFGGGVGLICCCDMAIAVNNSEFCLSEVKLGLIPAVISPYLLETLGYKQALRYSITADKFDAARALELGMLTHVVPLEKYLSQEVDIIIQSILKNGPIAMQNAKKLLKEIYLNTNDINILGKTAEAIASIRVSNEGQEGLTAFLEKREPNWIVND